jgi:hypothetical protein
VASEPDFIVTGAGVAGLTAALLLARRGLKTKVIEQSTSVGGLAGAETFRGLPCDIGSHRLHPSALSSPTLLEVHQAQPFAARERRGVLLIEDQKVSYPPSAVALLRALGPRIALSFTRSAVRRRISFGRWESDRPLRAGDDDMGFERFVVDRVGYEAYRAFYAPYAEKVWGLDPAELSQTVAKRRVSTSNPLRLFGDAAGALTAAVTRRPRESADTFLYPPQGISAIARYLHAQLVALGVPIELGTGLGRGGDLDLGLEGPPVLFSGRLVDLVPTTLEHRGLYLVFIALPIERASRAETHYCPESRCWFGRVSELSNYSPDLKRPGETILSVEIPEGRWGREADFASGARFGELYEQLERTGIVPPRVMPIEVRQRYVPDVYPLYRRGWLDEWEASMKRVMALKRVFPFGRQGLFLHCNIDHSVDIATDLVAHVAQGGDAAGWIERTRKYLEIRVRD